MLLYVKGTIQMKHSQLFIDKEPFQKQCQVLYSLCHCAAPGMILLEMSCPYTVQCERLQNANEAPRRKHLCRMVGERQNEPTFPVHRNWI